MTKAQKQKQLTVPMIKEHKRQVQNTEAVDFSLQFNPQAAFEESKNEPELPLLEAPQKSTEFQGHHVDFVDFRTLPQRHEREIIADIKAKLGDNQEAFNNIRHVAVLYNKHHTTAQNVFDVFLENLGVADGVEMFPHLICSMKNKSKQDELNKCYVHFVESSQPVTEDGRCTNEFYECRTTMEYLMSLHRVLQQYLTKNPSQGKALYIDPNIIKQMIAMIERFSETEMLQLKCLMNFLVSDKTYHNISRALKLCKDAAFNSGLTEKYEDYFFKDLDPFELYVASKFVSMCIIRLNGQSLKGRPELLENAENEQVKDIAVIKAEEARREEAKKEAEAVMERQREKAANQQKKVLDYGRILKGRSSQPVPEDNQQNFPSLGRPEGTGATGNWGNSRADGARPSAAAAPQKTPEEDFPTLPTASHPGRPGGKNRRKKQKKSQWGAQEVEQEPEMPASGYQTYQTVNRKGKVQTMIVMGGGPRRR